MKVWQCPVWQSDSVQCPSDLSPIQLPTVQLLLHPLPPHCELILVALLEGLHKQSTLVKSIMSTRKLWLAKWGFFWVLRKASAYKLIFLDKTVTLVNSKKSKHPKKFRIRETKHISTDADRSTDTTEGWTKNTPKLFFFEKRKTSSKTQKLKKF